MIDWKQKLKNQWVQIEISHVQPGIPGNFLPLGPFPFQYSSGEDMFNQPADKEDEEGEDKAEDKVKVKAALQTGLLGKGIAEEEERMAGENRR